MRSCMCRRSPYAIGLILAVIFGGGVAALALFHADPSLLPKDASRLIGDAIDIVFNIQRNDFSSGAGTYDDDDETIYTTTASSRGRRPPLRPSGGVAPENVLFKVNNVHWAFSGNEWTRLLYAIQILTNLSTLNVHSYSAVREDLQYSVKVVKKQHHLEQKFNSYAIIENATHYSLFLEPQDGSESPSSLEPGVARILSTNGTCSTFSATCRERACMASMPHSETFYNTLISEMPDYKKALIVYTWDYIPCHLRLSVFIKMTVVSFGGRNIYTPAMRSSNTKRQSLIVVFNQNDLITCDNINRVWEFYNHTATRYVVYEPPKFPSTTIFLGSGDPLWCGAAQTQFSKSNIPILKPSGMTIKTYLRSAPLHLVEIL